MALDDRYTAKCIRCSREYEATATAFTCPSCGLPLELALDISRIEISWREVRSRSRGVWRYRELLPSIDEKHIVSLREGGTPLIPLEEGSKIFVKFEGANPTGSFKDRGMTVGVSIAKAMKFRATIVASTGNTAASVAAYSARAGMQCFVVVPRGKIARGKVSQVVLHGAKIVEIDGFFDDALKSVLENVEKLAELGIYPLNSFNPWRLEGQKTIAFEIFDDMGVPDTVIVPVGNAGNIYAIWKGFEELRELGLIDRVPRMIGVQASRSAPLYLTWIQRSRDLITVEKPETVASAIRIGKPVNWLKALKAVEESKGFFIAVDDEEILEAQRELAKRGIGVEPASAASYAGYKKLVEMKAIDRDEVVVLIATGHALKDPDTPMRFFSSITIRRPEELIEVLRSSKD